MLQPVADAPEARSGRTRGPARPAVVLGVVLVAVLAINLDTTIVNVALPSLGRQLGASTSGLQWVVDGYNLAFAALVLTGGNLGDRYGRRGALVAGLGLFSVASVAAAACTSIGELVTARVAMGVGAALIFPTTLSIITVTFPDRTARAKAIGAWGAVAGLGVAIGPIVGGALLDHFWWGSVFLALVPVAVLAALAALVVVPHSRHTERPPMDLWGLVLSALALGALVYTIIEAPTTGWTSVRTLVGFGLAGVLLGTFAVAEHRHPRPMLDVRLFSNARFSAASGSVAVAFFSLFGFIFLITQYFQVIRGYGPLETGVRILPVAASIAVGSLVGTRLAMRLGNKIVVGAGLCLLGAAFAWISTASATLPYSTISVQMILLGAGMGLTSSPATESIMGAVRPEQAGAGSAVNDATREVGGTLGVAVLGSIFASLYASHLASALTGLPASMAATARSSVEAGATVAARLAADHRPQAGPLHQAVVSGFLSGLHAGCLTVAVLCIVGAVGAVTLLPSRPKPAPLPADTRTVVTMAHP